MPDVTNLSASKRALLEKYLRGGLSQKTAVESIPHRSEEAPPPLAFVQESFWLLSQMTPNAPTDNDGLLLSIPGPLDSAVLQRSLNELIRRHEAWRTSFPLVDGAPIQFIHPPSALPLPLVDLRAHPAAEREREARRLGAELVDQPFDLQHAPPLRALLVRLTDDAHWLFLAVHHIIFDGYSAHQVLLPELSTLYQAFSAGQPSPLPELPLQYADYALWQRDTLQGPLLEKLLAYWKKQLANAPNEVAMPTDHPSSLEKITQKAYEFSLPRRLSSALTSLCQQGGVTLFTALLAAYGALLYRYSGQEDIVIGAPTTVREPPEVDKLLGVFINTLPLRLDLSGNPSFRELLKRAQDVMAGALTHAALPFDQLVRHLQPERVAGQNPFFQMLLDLQPAIAEPPSGWSITQLPALNRSANFVLTLDLHEQAEGLSGHFRYRADLFEEETIQRMAGHWQTLLEGLVSDLDRPISLQPLATKAERQQLLVDWNATQATFPQERCVHELFEEQAARHPMSLAVVYEGRRLTYQELNERANQLAHHLRGLGVGPESLVGLYIERSVDMLVGLLGILKAGGAYVPLDPGYPAERVAFMLKDAQAAVVVTQQALAERLPPLEAQLCCVDRDWQNIAKQSKLKATPLSSVTGANLAYMIYTSGSTGAPKGVLVEHQQLLNYVQGILPRLQAPAGAQFALVSTIAADLGNTMLYPALCTGGCLHIIAQERAADPAALAEYCRQHPIDYLKIVPSHLAALLTAQHPEPILPRKTLVLGGEAYSWELLQQIHRLAPQCRILNHFGPTETTVGVLTYDLDPEQAAALSPTVIIGRPLPNSQVYILDPHMQPTPIGIPGELYIGGAGVARGYLHRPELTAERFVPNPFSAEPGARLYKTGDRARYLPSGAVEFLGRLDFQVKIRGYRIEPGEIEAALRQHPTVREALVLALDHESGEKRLVAYITLRGSEIPPGAALRAFLGERVPAHMIPSAFVLLEALPLTPNGKIDRKALPPPEQDSLPPGEDFIAPRTPTEEQLAAIWADLLGVPQVSVTENFFALGGHSLLAVRVLSRMQAHFQIELPLSALFEAPTIAELALRIAQVQTGQEHDGALSPRGAAPAQQRSKPITRRSAAGQPAPLSFAQQSLWLVDKLTPGQAGYHLPCALRLTGPLNHAALEQSIQEIARRHESLRTTFRIIEGQPRQMIAPVLRVPFDVADMQHLAEGEREERARQRIDAEMARPFDLEQGPLVRVTLLRLAENDALLVVIMHHTITDGWSKDILVSELTTLYAAFSTGQPSPLPELPIQYADYALWQRERLQGEQMERLLTYWKKQLSGAPEVLELPSDHPRPAVYSFRGGYLPFQMPAALVEQLKTLSQQERSTLFMTLLAAFQTLLARYTGRDDIVVGSPIANRARAETEGLIGYLVNMLVLRATFTDHISFRDLLRQVRATALEAYAHQDMPIEKLVEVLQPQRSLSYNPLFQALFAVEKAPPSHLEAGKLTWQAVDVGSTVAKVDLALNLQEDEQGWSGAFEYSTDLFEKATIERLLGHWLTLLEGIASNPDQPVATLPLLTQAEQQQILVDWNQTDAPYPADRCFHHLFEEQAARIPDALAAAYGKEQVSYRQLNERANQLAHHLRQLGVGPETLVGLYMSRSITLLVGLLGIMKAGGAYVPLDPTYPAERIAFMLADSQVRLVVTETAGLHHIPEHHAQVVLLDNDWPEIAQQRTENPDSQVNADNLAYMIYTSGSTGRPKGVLITHRGVPNLAEMLRQAYQIEPGCRVLEIASFSFDASVADMLMAWHNGGTLYLATDDERVPGPAMLRLLQEQAITLAVFMPSILATLPHAELPALRTILAAGEACSADLVAKWANGRRFFNAYGPTEYTVAATGTECTDTHTPPPIGRPLLNTQAYVLDTHLQPVPIGVPGELFLGGVQLARGYHQRPELTAEKFIRHPFSADPAARLYRTGDLVRWRADGNLEFVGRVDHQVKIRGFRIELGEIEALLLQDPAVREAVVVAREDTPGNKRLIAYLVPEPHTTIALNALREALAAQLPAYMHPAVFITLDALPLTSNGKVNLRALPAPAEVEPLHNEELVLPRTPIEAQLAAIWAEQLDLKQVGITQNFFDLGGHSLLGIRVLWQVEERLQVELPFSTLFEAPTIAELALKVVQHQAEQVDDALVFELLAELEQASDTDIQNLLAIEQRAERRGVDDE
jgi:amino acid adenylation domain-containing protein